ncbi:MAG: DNA-directed RNA polymerase subunit beta' [Dehalococcoidia bacterium]|nr:DNA-directed RNA polymerase subunit beta' [Dehalococcoidia bacterium]
MLEVNDFNAVRISLASPEQIKSWSYGEVTKPETINYRTLKPERDGLFCEKIFGPTKDFECYCGKYKRIRYKGVICDKCGVEVARSRVRRERMGHIALAAPVTHIWFVKGTPSRFGLLLDISPRSLERVIYFAQYIITEINEEAKEAAIQESRDRLESDIAKLEADLKEGMAQRSHLLEEALAAIETRIAEQTKTSDQKGQKALDKLSAEEASLLERLQKLAGEAAPDTISLHSESVVEAGVQVDDTHLSIASELAARKREEVEASHAEDLLRIKDLAEAEMDRLKYVAAQEIEELHAGSLQQQQRLREDGESSTAELEDLAPLRLLNEAQYREMTEKFGGLFKAGMGAEAILDVVGRINLDSLREELRKEVNSTSGQRRKKAIKRLRVVEAFRKSGNKPDWMILNTLPVLPPDLRPMVQLDGGRFATSDLNDLYRRVINRNNRLRRLLELGAPEIIIRNEKRMLQEAVDSLIDNGRRGRAVSAATNHRLKSLSDMLKGKQGRFRQNLLGKRVDYSGRSVIIVGPDLKLHQCGLPKKMALELFKPFVMRRLVERGLAHNIKSAKRVVERVKPEVWDILEEVIQDRLILLNRAPTLHRLGIQAFQPILVEGSAIQIHPLVCAAFNADFDGDQMAVHVPLSSAAVEEARRLMLSVNNLLLPSSGEPTVAPTLDMVLGCYYLTLKKPGALGEGSIFASPEEARLAYDLGHAALQAEITVHRGAGDVAVTTIGRIIFGEILPPELGFRDQEMDKKALRQLVSESVRRMGNQRTAELVDAIKHLGFQYATRSGITISINDISVPSQKQGILHGADEEIANIDRLYRRGLMDEEERYNKAITIWTQAGDDIEVAVKEALDRFGPVAMMATSGAKGNISQIRQMAGMRGLMTDPSGRIIDLPIRSNFREGLTVLEYFISTHGARKGLADTALRTADSGYLTRRLIDVSQDVVVTEEDCGTTVGHWIFAKTELGMLEPYAERIRGRWTAAPVADPGTGEILLEANEEIDEEKADAITAAGVEKIYARSPLSCQTRRGVCRTCYGRSLTTGKKVERGEAVGIVAAQSIGEPGTQLTMRTFHTGGVVGLDITSGLPRVEELFEARIPKGQAIVSEIDGVVEVTQEGESSRILVTSSETYREEHTIPPGYQAQVRDNDWVDVGTPLAETPIPEGSDEADTAVSAGAPPVASRLTGRVVLEGDQIVVVWEDKEEREYLVSISSRVKVENGDVVKAGESLTEGPVNPQDILRILGREAVQAYLVDEVQKVYRSQGVSINDKHIETITRQMLRKVRVDSPGDTEMLPGELVDRFQYEEINARVLAEGGEPATAQPVLLGVTKASLTTQSFLAAASFQETTRVLTEASIAGAVDRLVGLKENVIIGKLIPAGSGVSPKAHKPSVLLAPPIIEVPLDTSL